MSEQKIEKPDSAIGYKKACELAKSHYENFPVASLLIHAKFRNDIAIVYWFARTADDYADEGNYSATVKLEKLKSFEDRLKSLLKDNPAT